MSRIARLEKEAKWYHRLVERHLITKHLLCSKGIITSINMRYRYSLCRQSSDPVSSKNLTTHPVKPIRTFFSAMWTENVLEALPTGTVSFLYFISLQVHPRVGSNIMVVYLGLLSVTDFSFISASHRRLPMKQCEPMK